MQIHADTFFPFISWIRGYRLRHLKADLMAGFTVAVVAAPQSMAYALIAGLPVQYGLYASIVPTVVGSLWGSSAHLITGPTTATSLVVYSTLKGMAPPGSPDYISLAFFLAFWAGMIKLALGIARLGVLLNFVSHSVLLGFMTGAAVLIGFSQVHALLGLTADKGGTFTDSVVSAFSHLHQIHGSTCLLGLATVAIIVGMKRFRPHWPGTLMALIAAGSAVGLMDLERAGVRVIGAVPGGLPGLSLPGYGLVTRMGDLAPGALAIAILGLVEAVSIAKAIAGESHQRIDVNREFIGQGLAGVSASLFSGYPVSGSLTRSAVNFRSGGKTPVSGVVSSLGIAGVLLLAAPLAAVVPHAALAGVLMVTAADMVSRKDIARAVRATRGDAAVLGVTFLSTLFLHLEFAVYVGVLLSIGLHLAVTSHPRIYSVIPDGASGKMTGSTFGKTCCQMDIVQIEGSIFFGSAVFVQEDLERRLRHDDLAASLLIRMHHVNTLDASGVHVLEILLEAVRERGGGLFFSGVNRRVLEVFKNSGLMREIGEGRIHRTTGGAIRQAMRDVFCPAVCAACDTGVFMECPELKQGNWEIFGRGVRPRMCGRPPDERI